MSTAMSTTTEDAEYAAFAAALGVPVETPPAPPRSGKS